MAEINNSAIIVEFVVLLFAIQFAVSYGDNNNDRHLARCIQFYIDNVDNKTNTRSKNELTSRSDSSESGHSTTTPTPATGTTATATDHTLSSTTSSNYSIHSNGQDSTNNNVQLDNKINIGLELSGVESSFAKNNNTIKSKIIRYGMIGLIVSHILISIIFGGYFMFDKYKTHWYDNYYFYYYNNNNNNNKETYSQMISIRIIFWILWTLYGVLGWVLLITFRFANYFKFGKLIRIRFEKFLIIIMTTTNVIIGIYTLCYLFTFNNNPDAYLTHFAATYWFLKVIVICVENGLFGYYFYIRKDFDRSYESLTRIIFVTFSVTFSFVSLIITGVWDTEMTKDEIVNSALAMEMEISVMGPVIWIIFETDTAVKVLHVGKSRWPWSKCLNSD